MITTLTGSNSYARRTELLRLIEAFLAEYSDLGLERIDGEEVDFNRIRESLQSLPFLATKKLVVLRTPGALKEFTDQVESLLKELPETTDVIIVEPKLDRRSSYYKTLKKITDFKDFNELDNQSLAKWLTQQAKTAHGSLSFGDSLYLTERIGSNQQLLSNELNKLLTYDANITRKTIDLLTETTPQSTVFELLDAAFAGKIDRALQLYVEQRRQKVEPQQILAMIAWQLHILALIKTAGERSNDEIAREAKLNPFVVRKSQGIVRNLTLNDLKRLIQEVLELDISLKTRSINADEALQTLLITLSKRD